MSYIVYLSESNLKTTGNESCYLWIYPKNGIKYENNYHSRRYDVIKSFLENFDIWDPGFNNNNSNFYGSDDDAERIEISLESREFLLSESGSRILWAYDCFVTDDFYKVECFLCRK